MHLAIVVFTEEKEIFQWKNINFMSSHISQTARRCCEENKSVCGAKDGWSEGIVLQLVT